MCLRYKQEEVDWIKRKLLRHFHHSRPLTQYEKRPRFARLKCRLWSHFLPNSPLFISLCWSYNQWPLLYWNEFNDWNVKGSFPWVDMTSKIPRSSRFFQNMWTMLGMTALPHVGGFLGGLITRNEVKTWYQTIQKPSWRPPNAAFPVVWTCLYTGMG